MLVSYHLFKYARHLLLTRNKCINLYICILLIKIISSETAVITVLVMLYYQEIWLPSCKRIPVNISTDITICSVGVVLWAFDIWCFFIFLLKIYSGVESMGEEIKVNGRFWWWRIQTDAMCWRSSSREAYHVETRRGVDGAIAAFGCAFEFLQWSVWTLGRRSSSCATKYQFVNGHDWCSRNSW